MIGEFDHIDIGVLITRVTDLPVRDPEADDYDVLV